MKKLIIALFVLVSCSSASEIAVILPNQEDVYDYNLGVTCSEYRVALDEREQPFISDEHEVAATEAVQTWNDLLGVDIFRFVSDAMCVKADIHIRVQQEDYPLAHTLQQLSPDNPCFCSVNVSAQAQGSVKIYEHELGHCLGLTHSEDPASLMYKNAYGGDFTEGMLESVRRNLTPDLVGPPRVSYLIPGCAEVP